MTKIITSPDINFGFVDEFRSSVTNSKITNTGTERVTLTNLVSSDERFVLNSFDTRIEPKMPANSTLYFGANGRIQSATGAYYTTDQGFGSIGTTDSDGKLTVNYLMSSLALTAPSAGTSFILESVITVQWTASANIPLVNIIIESATGIKTVSNIDATLGTYDVPMIADSGSFDFGQELVITVENSLQTISDSVTVEIRQATLQDFRIERSESEYRVAEDIHFTAYVNYGNLPSIWTVYAQYSSDGITYEDIQYAIEGGSGLANITGCLIPAGASGTIYLRARIPKALGDSVYSNSIEAVVVTPEIVITPVAVTVGVPFTISGTCNLAKNLRISYAKDPYSSWTWVDNSVTVQPSGTWSVEGVVISETGNFRIKAEYIQDTVSMFSDTEDVVVESDLDFLVISAGSNHSLGIWDGKVYAWGRNNYGQLGDGSTTQRNKPVAVAVDTSLAGKTVVGISAGDSFSLALCDDGTVHAWGNNGNGQLGDGSTTQRNKPVAVAVDTSLAGKTVVGISAGNSFSLAVCADGTVHAWGNNAGGQIGNGSIYGQIYKPVAVAVDTSLFDKKVVMVSASVKSHSLALCDDGTVHAWGNNGSGQLGDGSTTLRSKPVAVAVDTSLAGKFVTYVSAGCGSSHCVCDDGTAHGWGDNAGGQLGDNSTTKRSKPVAVNIDTSLAGKTVIGLCGGKSTDAGYGDHGWCVAVCADGTVHAWGYNSYGQLGDGSTTQKLKPVAMAVDTSLAGKTATQVSSGQYFTLIKCNDGTAHAVGYNSSGQLGDNSTTQRTKAVLVDTSGI